MRIPETLAGALRVDIVRNQGIGALGCGTVSRRNFNGAAETRYLRRSVLIAPLPEFTLIAEAEIHDQIWLQIAGETGDEKRRELRTRGNVDWLTEFVPREESAYIQ